MKSSPVRDLARRYAAGELSQESYRNQRRALISAITNGSQPLTYRDDDPAGSVHIGRIKLLGLAAAAVLVLATVFVVSWRAVDRQHAHANPANADAAPAAPDTPAAPGPALVRSFVETNDWADASVEDFVRDWHKLTADDQTRARASLLYPRLESQLREQISSERAMAGAGTSMQADPHLAQLLKMAQTLGITDTR